MNNEFETPFQATPETSGTGFNVSNEMPPVQMGIPQPVSLPVLAPKKKINFFNILGIIPGILSIIFGIKVNGHYSGVSTSHITYGGDAYTGIQNAAADAANNIRYLIGVVKYGLSSILIVAGIVIIIAFLSKLIKDIIDR